jgi:REP element-mobilizing transposase RayT
VYRLYTPDGTKCLPGAGDRGPMLDVRVGSGFSRTRGRPTVWNGACLSPRMNTRYPRHIAGFDYLGIYRYFLTFCTDGRARHFEDPRAVALVWAQFLRAAEDEAFAILTCCLMPDHTHLLVEGLSDRADLKRFVSRAKQLAGYEFSKRFGKRLWQRYSYEHVLRNQESNREVMAYILENPVRAKLAGTVMGYPHVFSSVHTREELIEFVYYTTDFGSG